MKLLIKNFRSIQKQEVELAPLTVLYGANGSGKSSLLYALLSLKNIVLNPNQPPPGFFNYQFTSLGGFREVVFDHNPGVQIELGVAFEHEGFLLDYRMALQDTSGTFSLQFSDAEQKSGSVRLPVSFPYPLNQQERLTLSTGVGGETVLDNVWNGITAEVQSHYEARGGFRPPLLHQFHQDASALAAILNSPIERLRRVSFVPLRRGFSQPTYSSVPVSPMAITEHEVASLLASDRDLEYRVSHYLEQVLDRDFRVRPQIGVAFFFLESIDRRTGLGVGLVNEGFGVNQLVYLLAKALHPDTELVCVEEPEIHLHPTAIRRLAQAMVRMVRAENKRFLLSTHSESLVLALLAQVVEGALSPEDLACYLATKEGKATQFQRQHVNEKGQITGGLRSFMEGELEDVKTFLKL